MIKSYTMSKTAMEEFRKTLSKLFFDDEVFAYKIEEQEQTLAEGFFTATVEGTEKAFRILD